MILEPNLVSEHRFVRPVHVIRLARLLHVLMDIGCVNCMVLPKCFELAVVRWLSTCPLRVSESGGLADRAESFALRLTSHVQAVFAMLRILHHEDQKSQLQKTMPFRKKASAADWVVIESLLHRVVPSPPWYSHCDTAGVASSQASPSASPQASPRASRPSDIPSGPRDLAEKSKCDEHGFPLVFQLFVDAGASQGCGSSRRSMSLGSAASIPSTVFYEEVVVVAVVVAVVVVVVAVVLACANRGNTNRGNTMLACP